MANLDTCGCDRIPIADITLSAGSGGELEITSLGSLDCDGVAIDPSDTSGRITITYSIWRPDQPSTPVFTISIYPGSDASLYGSWTYISGSLTDTEFQTLLLPYITGTGHSFSVSSLDPLIFQAQIHMQMYITDSACGDSGIDLDSEVIAKTYLLGSDDSGSNGGSGGFEAARDAEYKGDGLFEYDRVITSVTYQSGFYISERWSNESDTNEVFMNIDIALDSELSTASQYLGTTPPPANQLVDNLFPFFGNYLSDVQPFISGVAGDGQATLFDKKSWAIHHGFTNTANSSNAKVISIRGTATTNGATSLSTTTRIPLESSGAEYNQPTFSFLEGDYFVCLELVTGNIRTLNLVTGFTETFATGKTSRSIAYDPLNNYILLMERYGGDVYEISAPDLSAVSTWGPISVSSVFSTGIVGENTSIRYDEVNSTAAIPVFWTASSDIIRCWRRVSGVWSNTSFASIDASLFAWRITRIHTDGSFFVAASDVGATSAYQVLKATYNSGNFYDAGSYTYEILANTGFVANDTEGANAEIIGNAYIEMVDEGNADGMSVYLFDWSPVTLVSRLYHNGGSDATEANNWTRHFLSIRGDGDVDGNESTNEFDRAYGPWFDDANDRILICDRNNNKIKAISTVSPYSSTTIDGTGIAATTEKIEF